MTNAEHLTTATVAFDAVATPATLDDVAGAQLTIRRIFEARGSYGCEHHLFVAATRRVSAILFAV